MRELERQTEVPILAPVQGADLPWGPALASLLRRLTTLRTAKEGMAPMEGPMESAPCGLSQDDPSVLRHIPLLSARNLDLRFPTLSSRCFRIDLGYLGLIRGTGVEGPNSWWVAHVNLDRLLTSMTLGLTKS